MRIAVAADGFESFVGSQYEPDNTHILVGSRSQFLYTDEKREYVRETVQFSRSVPNCLELTWSQILLWFRMVGNVDRLTGGYMPAYIWM